ARRDVARIRDRVRRDRLRVRSRSDFDGAFVRHGNPQIAPAFAPQEDPGGAAEHMQRTDPTALGDLRARTVVVTGASAGVGRAVAQRFARAGARIGLIARDAEALECVRQEVEQLGGSATAAPADVADADAVFAAADRIRAALGPIDVWIN